MNGTEITRFIKLEHQPSWVFSEFLFTGIHFVASGAVETYRAKGSYLGLPECDCRLIAKVVNDKNPKWEIAQGDHCQNIYSWSPLAKSLSTLRSLQTAWNYTNACILDVCADDYGTKEYYEGVTIGGHAITLRRQHTSKILWHIMSDQSQICHNLRIHSHRHHDLEKMRGSVAADMCNYYAEGILMIFTTFGFPADCFPRVRYYLFSNIARPLIRAEMVQKI